MSGGQIEDAGGKTDKGAGQLDSAGGVTKIKNKTKNKTKKTWKQR
jgi:hypothetical protein